VGQPADDGRARTRPEAGQVGRRQRLRPPAPNLQSPRRKRRQVIRPRRNRRTQERSQGQGSPDPDAGNPYRRLRAYGPKVLAAELRKDNWLMLQFGVAKELGLSLTEVRTTMTAEELLGWSAYFQILNEDQQKEIEKAKRRR
jgi:hypothetical protein